ASAEDFGKQHLKWTFDDSLQLSGHAGQRNDPNMVCLYHGGGGRSCRILYRASSFRQSSHLQSRFAHFGAAHITLRNQLLVAALDEIPGGRVDMKLAVSCLCEGRECKVIVSGSEPSAGEDQFRAPLD